jgi:beta-phosphoglucomutase
MIKAIIFDMDGVLVDSMRFQAEAWAKVFKEINIKITRTDIYELEGLNNKEIIKAIFAKIGKKPETWQFEYLVKKKREILEFDKIKPFINVPDCIKELKHYFKLATVSGSSRYMVEKVLNTFFPICFEVIITGDDFEHGKPDPEPYTKALEKLNIASSECIVVENAPIGITAAKRAGLYCVAVASTLAIEKLQLADLVFEDHTVLLAYLNNLTHSCNFFNTNT